MPRWGTSGESQHRRIFGATVIVTLIEAIFISQRTQHSSGMATTRAIEEVRSLLAGAHLAPEHADRLRLSRFTNPPHLSTALPDLPSHIATTITTAAASDDPPSPPPRLIVIGDVHGQLACLRALLAEAGYDAARGDRVVLAGDLINKGPDSAGVAALAMDQGFAAVRDNHEDKVLRVFALAEAVQAEVGGGSDGSGSESGEVARRLEEWEDAALSKSDRAALATARSLTPEQRDWIAARPLLLRLDARAIVSGHDGSGAEGPAAAEAPRDEVIVVHAGVVPGVVLEDQDPWALMSMRTLLYPGKKGKLHGEDSAVRSKFKDLHPTAAPPSDAEVEAESRRLLEHYCSCSRSRVDGSDNSDDATAKQKDKKEEDGIIPAAVPVATREGRSWAKAWDAIERAKPAGAPRTTVVYGHDARKGLNVKEYTFGLDSGCVKGGRLTALVFEEAEGGVVRRRLVSVGCQAAESEGEEKSGNKEKKDKSKDKEKKDKKKEKD